jgi:hypothetical protein
VKTFDTYTITKKQLRKQICEFAKSLGVKRVVFSNKGIYVKGTYNAFNNIMYLDTNQTKLEMLHAFFHELGHHTAVLKHKWNEYHHCTVPSMRSSEIFKIENGIDKIGKALWNKHVNIKEWGKYKYSYPKAQKNNIINNFINKR